jgi:hypothetical protein
MATLVQYIEELESYIEKINLYIATSLSYTDGMVSYIETVDYYNGFRLNKKVFSRSEHIYHPNG